MLHESKSTLLSNKTTPQKLTEFTEHLSFNNDKSHHFNNAKLNGKLFILKTLRSFFFSFYCLIKIRFRIIILQIAGVIEIYGCKGSPDCAEDGVSSGIGTLSVSSEVLESLAEALTWSVLSVRFLRRESMLGWRTSTI